MHLLPLTSCFRFCIQPLQLPLLRPPLLRPPLLRLPLLRLPLRPQETSPATPPPLPAPQPEDNLLLQRCYSHLFCDTRRCSPRCMAGDATRLHQIWGREKLT